jgi:alpha-beta hydrolase superfamily lysophospholipase
VHGLGEHSGRYGNLIDVLIPQGIGVHSYDQRGHGRSPGTVGHIDSWSEYREDLRCFVEQVRGQIPLFLFGHSMGGLVALDYALHYPADLNGLLLSSPALAVDNETMLRFVAATIGRILPNMPIRSGLDVDGLSRNQDVVQRYKDDELVHGKVTPRWLGELLATIDWVHEHAAQLAMPLLMTHGTADRLVPFRGTQRFFDSAASTDKQLIIYPDTYHEPHNDINYPEAVDNIRTWLNKRLETKSSPR